MTDTMNLDLELALDQTLTDLISFGLLAKQAHWNVVGPSFPSLHALLDKLAAIARDGGDRIAERAATLGRSPDGRPETVAMNNPLPPLDPGPLRDTDAMAVFDGDIAIIRTRLIASIRAAAGDAVTQGILVSVADELDKVAWMIRSHRPHDRSAAAAGRT